MHLFKFEIDYTKRGDAKFAEVVERLRDEDKSSAIDHYRHTGPVSDWIAPPSLLTNGLPLTTVASFGTQYAVHGRRPRLEKLFPANTVQLLPIDIRGWCDDYGDELESSDPLPKSPFFVLHPLHRIEIKKSSKGNFTKGLAMEIDEIHLDMDLFRQLPRIFYAGGCAQVYCNEEFVRLFEQSGGTGIVFKTIPVKTK